MIDNNYEQEKRLNDLISDLKSSVKRYYIGIVIDLFLLAVCFYDIFFDYLPTQFKFVPYIVIPLILYVSFKTCLVIFELKDEIRDLEKGLSK